MKKLKSVGQYFVALALAVVISFGAVTPAYAASATVGTVVLQAAISGAVGFLTEKVLEFFDETLSQGERDEALSVIHDYWVDDSVVPFDDTSSVICVDPDELSRIAADLTMSGFPCEVVSYGYAMPSGTYKYIWVIQCNGWVYVPGVVEPEYSDGGFGGGDFAFSLLGRYFTIDGQWLYAEDASSSSMLKSGSVTWLTGAMIFPVVPTMASIPGILALSSWTVLQMNPGRSAAHLQAILTSSTLPAM